MNQLQAGIEQETSHKKFKIPEKAANNSLCLPNQQIFIPFDDHFFVNVKYTLNSKLMYLLVMFINYETIANDIQCKKRS